MKRFFAILLILSLAIGVCACSQPPDTDTSGSSEYDPTMHVTFLDAQSLFLSADQTDAVLHLSNGSDVDITAVSFAVTGDAGKIATAPLNVPVAQKRSEAVTFDFSSMNLTDGTYSVDLSYTWLSQGGELRTGTVGFRFIKLRATDPNDGEDEPDRDVTKTPIAELTEEETETLAQHLFDKYVPCTFGIFNSPDQLSSASIWASIEFLNSVVDSDTSAKSRTLADVKAKVARYYPDAEFDETSVRLYQKDTRVFLASPIVLQEYTYLSCAVEGEIITVFYENVPEDKEEEPSQYATSFKNSADEGYFAFVSTVRVGAVG